jgi:hypothetical protein
MATGTIRPLTADTYRGGFQFFKVYFPVSEPERRWLKY